MKENSINFIKNKKIIAAICIVIVIVIILILLIPKFQNNNLVGRWEVEDKEEWLNYCVDSLSIYQAVLPEEFELFSDGTGIITYSGISTYSGNSNDRKLDDITWHAGDERLLIDDEVFNYKFSFGKLILNYQNEEFNYTITYKRK